MPGAGLATGGNLGSVCHLDDVIVVEVGQSLVLSAPRVPAPAPGSLAQIISAKLQEVEEHPEQHRDGEGRPPFWEQG